MCRTIQDSGSRSKTAREVWGANVPPACPGVIEGQVLPRDATTVVLLLVSRERFDHGHRLLLIHESADQPVVEQVIETSGRNMQPSDTLGPTGGSGKSP